MPNQEKLQILKRGTAEIINEDALLKKLSSKKKLRVKAGFDPTAPDIHLGHVVLLRKLRQFQDMGYEVDFLIGDFTALIGDPTGKNKLRPKLDKDFIKENAKTYKKQAFKVLDEKKTNVVFNSKWLNKLSVQEMLELTAHCTVAQMLARSDFKKRFDEQTEISILEFIYPLLQGYDSVELKSDIELGGTDQKFNLLMGRQIQEVYGQEPQVVIMTPLIEGTDGVQKMSKSLDNYIGINEPPKEIFGKIMSISDELMMKYYEFLTDCNLQEINGLHPKEAKLRLGEEIVAQFYNPKQAQDARKDFEQTFSQRQVPEDIQEYQIPASGVQLVDIIIDMKLAPSKKEFLRLLQAGAISHEGVKIQNADWIPQKGVLKVGKRRFLKLV